VRSIFISLVLALTACGSPPPPETAKAAPPTTGTCDDGAMIGKASETGRISCDKGRSCVLSDKGPTCLAEAENKEACGMISCGNGCSCANAENSDCLCPTLGAPPK
jgi:hypothetical protein